MDVWIGTCGYGVSPGEIFLRHGVFTKHIDASKWAVAKRDEIRATGKWATAKVERHALNDPTSHEQEMERSRQQLAKWAEEFGDKVDEPA